jgi:regulator of protease activity HflC (stomatin/prohibitin superfamily)
MTIHANVVLLLAMIFLFLIWLFKCLNILREYERAVVLRLGRVLRKAKGPGRRWLTTFADFNACARPLVDGAFPPRVTPKFLSAPMC